MRRYFAPGTQLDEQGRRYTRMTLPSAHPLFRLRVPPTLPLLVETLLGPPSCWPLEPELLGARAGLAVVEADLGGAGLLVADGLVLFEKQRDPAQTLWLVALGIGMAAARRSSYLRAKK